MAAESSPHPKAAQRAAFDLPGKRSEVIGRAERACIRPADRSAICADFRREVLAVTGSRRFGEAVSFVPVPLLRSPSNGRHRDRLDICHIDDPASEGSVSDLWRFTLPFEKYRVSGEHRLHKNLNLSARRL